MSLPFPNQNSGSVGLDPKTLQAMDAPLIALTNQCGGDLRRLMFAFFSFLHRRTDFYAVPHPDDLKDGSNNTMKMGFREGDAEKLLLAAFRQFPLRRIPSQKQKPSSSTTTAKELSSSTSGTEKTVTVPRTAETQKKTATSSTETDEANADSNVNTEGESQQTGTTSEESAKKQEKDNSTSDVQYTEDGLQIPVGNGGSTKRYKWTQTINECSVLIGIPSQLKGKDLAVAITPSTISVRTKKALPGEDSPRAFIETGKLVEKIRADESTWSLEGGVLVLTLDKLKNTFWDTVIVGDDKIDTSLVDSRRHIGEYDDATQQQIRKIIFDQNQERQGLPTSDEITGKKTIPNLPPGVEYIDQKKVDENTSK